MKQQVIALKLHGGLVLVEGDIVKMNLPDGCLGICFAFESKKAAREYWGKDVPMVQIEKCKDFKGD